MEIQAQLMFDDYEVERAISCIAESAVEDAMDDAERSLESKLEIIEYETDNRITDVERTAADDVDGVEAEVESLNTKVNDLETIAVANEVFIDDLETKIEQLTAQVSGLLGQQAEANDLEREAEALVEVEAHRVLDETEGLDRDLRGILKDLDHVAHKVAIMIREDTTHPVSTMNFIAVKVAVFNTILKRLFDGYMMHS